MWKNVPRTFGGSVVERLFETLIDLNKKIRIPIIAKIIIKSNPELFHQIQNQSKVFWSRQNFSPEN